MSNIGFALFLLGMVAIAVFILMGLFSLIKKNGKAKKRFLFAGVSLAVMVLGAVFMVAFQTDEEKALNEERRIAEVKAEKAQEEKDKAKAEAAAKEEKEKKEAAAKKKAEEAKKKAEEAKKAKEEKEAAEKAKAEQVAKEKAEAKKKSEQKAKEEAEAKEKAKQEAAAKKKAEADKKAKEEREAKEAAAKAEADKKASAQTIRYAQMIKNPDRYAGEYVKYRGEIVQIQEGDDMTVIRLAVTQESYGWNPNEVIWVEVEGYTDFVDEDIVTVYGTVVGKHSYTSQAGWEITVPAMLADTVE
ncbi:cell envelope integrity protein TolA [Peribacillus frigoritolerans]|uniref:cell envelope integrity protein TolA n=1 Tax=Peribacillus frigoritolerans TaxID=450367 RepID=UPI0021D0BCC8|nr:cell envelope integrity protein TolA [Peribacillus frigoritolerans]MCU6602733.1 cell envelope integrity protein TolA [Peribacillus frigoritolerans]